MFKENSTTKLRKKKLSEDLIEVSNLSNQKIYKSISNGLASRKPIIESVENKIIKGGY
jgi:hypothetical protein